MFLACEINYYILNLKTYGHLVLYQFCDKNIMVEIQEFSVKSNNTIVLIMNNIGNYILLKENEPLRVFEYAKEALKQYETFRSPCK